MGITPMMSTARYLTETKWPGKVYLILGFRTPRDFIFRKEIAELEARNANLSVTVAMSRPGDEPWSGVTGHVDNGAARFGDWARAYMRPAADDGRRKDRAA